MYPKPWAQSLSSPSSVLSPHPAYRCVWNTYTCPATSISNSKPSPLSPTLAQISNVRFRERGLFPQVHSWLDTLYWVYHGKAPLIDIVLLWNILSWLTKNPLIFEMLYKFCKQNDLMVKSRHNNISQAQSQVQGTHYQ